MTLSTEELVKHFVDGALVSISFILLSIVIMFLLLFIRKISIKIGGKFVSSKEVIISTGNLNGFDLEPLKDLYDSHQLIEVLEALIAGVPIEEFLDKSMDTVTIRNLVKKHSKSPAKIVVEEEEVSEEEVYSLSELPSLGIDPNYLRAELAGIEYEIRNNTAYVKTFDGEIPYQILNIEEGILLYRIGAPSLLIEGND